MKRNGTRNKAGMFRESGERRPEEEREMKQGSKEGGVGRRRRRPLLAVSVISGASPSINIFLFLFSLFSRELCGGTGLGAFLGGPMTGCLVG